METKKKLLSKIHTYKKRRNDIHNEHKKKKAAISAEYKKKVAAIKKSIHEDRKNKIKTLNAEYKKKVSAIRSSLASYSSLYKDWDFRQRLLIVVHKHVCSFSKMENGTIRNLDFKNISDAEKLAVNIFCKFVLENVSFGVNGGVINEFLGGNMPRTSRGASDIRLKFTRSFKTNPDNSKMYAEFKRFFHDYHGEEELQKEIGKFPDVYIRARNRTKKSNHET